MKREPVYTNWVVWMAYLDHSAEPEFICVCQRRDVAEAVCRLLTEAGASKYPHVTGVLDFSAYFCGDQTGMLSTPERVGEGAT